MNHLSLMKEEKIDIYVKLIFKLKIIIYYVINNYFRLQKVTFCSNLKFKKKII